MNLTKIASIILLFLLFLCSCNQVNTSSDQSFSDTNATQLDSPKDKSKAIASESTQEWWEGNEYIIPKAGIKFTIPEGWVQKEEDGFSIINADINTESDIQQISLILWEPPSDDQCMSAESFAEAVAERFHSLKKYITVGEVSKEEISGNIFYLVPTVADDDGRIVSVYFYFKQAWNSVLNIMIFFPPEFYNLPEQNEKIIQILSSTMESSPSAASLSVGQWVNNSYLMDWAGIKITIPDGMRLLTEVDTGPVFPVEGLYYDFSMKERYPIPNELPVPQVDVTIVDSDRLELQRVIELLSLSFKERGISKMEQGRLTISGLDFLTNQMHIRENDVIILAAEKDNKIIGIIFSHPPMQQDELYETLKLLISPI